MTLAVIYDVLVT